MTDEAATKLGEESADKTSVKGWPVLSRYFVFCTARSAEVEPPDLAQSAVSG